MTTGNSKLIFANRIVLIHARRIVNSVDGVTPATARKICKFFFEDKFFTLKENALENSFDIYIKEEQDVSKKELQDKKVKRFKAFWGNGFKMYYYNEKGA